MSDKYLRRTTIFFVNGDTFDEELLEMLRSITPERNIGVKLKELASEYLKMSQPKLYEQVVEKLEADKQQDNTSGAIVTKDNIDNGKINVEVKGNMRKYL